MPSGDQDRCHCQLRSLSLPQPPVLRPSGCSVAVFAACAVPTCSLSVTQLPPDSTLNPSCVQAAANPGTAAAADCLSPPNLRTYTSVTLTRALACLPHCSGAVFAESAAPTYNLTGILLFMGSATTEGGRVVLSQLLLGPYK